MDLSSLIKKFETNSDGQTKVASDVAAPAPVTTPAQPADAVDSILKIAADLSGAEKQAELAHAKLAGQIMMDAALARLAQYEGAALKTASAAGYSEKDVEEATRIGYQAGLEAGIKQASEQASSGLDKLAAAAEVLSVEDLVKYAEQEGLLPELEKLAEAAYESGCSDAHEKIAEDAQMEFLKGAAETEILIDMFRKEAAPGPVAPPKQDPAQIAAMKQRVQAGKQNAAAGLTQAATQAVTAK